MFQKSVNVYPLAKGRTTGCISVSHYDIAAIWVAFGSTPTIGTFKGLRPA